MSAPVVDDRWLSAYAAVFGAARGNDRFVKVRAVGKLLSAWVAARAISPDTIAAVLTTDMAFSNST